MAVVGGGGGGLFGFFGPGELWRGVGVGVGAALEADLVVFDVVGAVQAVGFDAEVDELGWH